MLLMMNSGLVKSWSLEIFNLEVMGKVLITIKVCLDKNDFFVTNDQV